MMGGEIAVESQPARGSIFTVRLPTCCGPAPGANLSAGDEGSDADR